MKREKAIYKDLAIGEVIRRLRMGTGMTQEEFAHCCKLDRSYMSDLETNKKFPSFITIYKISIGLAVEPEDLVKELKENIDFVSAFEKEPYK